MQSTVLKKIIWTAIFAGVNVLYFYVLFGKPSNVVFCCDATSYLMQADLVLEQGPAAKIDWAGYRSYLNYALVGLVRELGWIMGARHEILNDGVQISVSSRYLSGSVFLYFLFGSAIILAFYGKKGFYPVFIALFMNPFLFSYVPFPLQEGQAVLFLVPLIAIVIITYLNDNRTVFILAVSLFIGISWMLKSSFVLIAVPAFLSMAIFIVLRVTSNWRRISYAGLAAAIAMTPVAPQLWASWTNFGSLDPYPNRAILHKQFAWGWAWWRYDTVFDQTQGQFRGLAFRSPFEKIPPQEFDLAAQVQKRPSAALALAVGHVFGAFNYANPKVYDLRFRLPAFSSLNLIVGVILFLGIAMSALIWSTRSFDELDLFIDGAIIGGVAVLPFLAVESRFSIVSFALLSVRAAQLFGIQRTGRERVLLVVGAALFSISFVLIGTLMYQTIKLNMVAE